jgi:hypothetical protein
MRKLIFNRNIYFGDREHEPATTWHANLGRSLPLDGQRRLKIGLPQESQTATMEETGANPVRRLFTNYISHPINDLPAGLEEHEEVDKEERKRMVAEHNEKSYAEAVRQRKPAAEPRP